MIKLGVNIDHIATVRQARKGFEPDPAAAAVIVELAGADSIVCHLREDRRHIQDRDVYVLKETVSTRLNLEMGLADEIIDIALKSKPHQVTLVPEKREELTTEGGLDAVQFKEKLQKIVPVFHQNGIVVSIFVDPERDQIQAAKLVRADMVEIHTGRYANAKNAEDVRVELHKLAEAAMMARNVRLGVAAGHGLNYRNVGPVTKIMEIEELNIGHSIISRAVLTGLERAVREMKEAINRKNY
ncbi:MAG: pyridoxine 5'-phosphate synthase [Planctomycetes bacterium]|nr:pyridoxine 5'-phosphate synthase [Planctomycetota bacterium]